MKAILNTICDYRNVRIALTDPDLVKGFLFLRSIASPDNIQYKGFSGTFGQSFGGQVQHGFKNVILTWENPNHFTVNKIRDYVETAITNSGYLYLTVPMNDGSKLGINRWVDVRVVPYPIEVEVLANFTQSIGIGYRNLTLFGNNLTIINDPATGL